MSKLTLVSAWDPHWLSTLAVAPKLQWTVVGALIAQTALPPTTWAESRPTEHVHRPTVPTDRQADGKYSLKVVNCGDSKAIIIRGPGPHGGFLWLNSQLWQCAESLGSTVSPIERAHTLLIGRVALLTNIGTAALMLTAVLTKPHLAISSPQFDYLKTQRALSSQYCATKFERGCGQAPPCHGEMARGAQTR